MERRLSLFLLTLLLVSCGMPSTPATATLIPSTAVVPTIAPTATPELSPTATEDPAPDSATGKDENGNWIKTVTQENGVTRTWTWDKEREVYTTILLTGYYMPTTPEWQKTQPWRAYIPLTVTIDETAPGSHSLPLFTMRPNNGEKISWTNNYFTQLTDNFIKAGFFSNSSDYTSDPWFDGLHTIHYDFITQEGQQSWGLWNDTINNQGEIQPGGIQTGVTVHIVSEGKPEDGFSKVSTEYPNYGPVTDFMIRLSTKDNNLIVEIALDPTRSLADLPRTLWIWMLNYGPSVVLDSCADRSTTCDLTTLPSWSQMLDQLVLNEKRLTPWFDVDLKK